MRAAALFSGISGRTFSALPCGFEGKARLIAQSPHPVNTQKRRETPSFSGSSERIQIRKSSSCVGDSRRNAGKLQRAPKVAEFTLSEAKGLVLLPRPVHALPPLCYARLPSGVCLGQKRNSCRAFVFCISKYRGTRRCEHRDGGRAGEAGQQERGPEGDRAT